MGDFRSERTVAETDSWLDLLRREGALSVDEEQGLHQRCQQLLGMLTTKINVLDANNRRSNRSIREDEVEYAVDDIIDCRLFYNPEDYCT